MSNEVSKLHSVFRDYMAVVHEYAMLGAGVVKRRREEALTAEDRMIGMYERLEEQLETAQRVEQNHLNFLAAAENEIQALRQALDDLNEGHKAQEDRAEVAESGMQHFARGLIAIAGETLDGFTGFHHVGDEKNPTECPGCVARSYLDGSARAPNPAKRPQ